jgi:hypothetical protein
LLRENVRPTTRLKTGKRARRATSTSTQIIENRATPYEALRKVSFYPKGSRPAPTCIADKTTDKNTKGINTHE